MSDKDAVLSRFPDAVCEHDPGDWWSVFDIPLSMTHGVRWHGDVARTRGLWGCGGNEAEAWADARRSIERHEGRKLTPNAELSGAGTGAATEPGRSPASD